MDEYVSKRAAGVMKSALLVAGLVSAQAGLSEVHDGVELSLGGFTSEYDGNDSLSSGSGGLGQIGYRFNNPYSVELQYMEADHSTRVGAVVPEVETSSVLLNVLRHFNSGAKSEPYLGIGLGEVEADNTMAAADGGSVNLSAGFKHHFSKHFLLRPEVTYTRATGDIDDSFFAVKLIVSATLGDRTPPPPPPPSDSDGDGVIDPKDKCPGTMVGEAVDPMGCPLPKDADGDGVFDEQDECPNTPAGTEVDEKGCKKPPQDSDGDGVFDHKDECPNTAEKLKVNEVGCPKRLTETVSIRLDIKFDSNSAKIKAEHYPEIQKVASFLEQYAGTVVQVEGHTDTLGKASYNKALSQKRADSVAKVLVDDMKISADRVTTIGYGEEQPIADDATQSGREMNRRVVAEISVDTERFESRE